MRAGDRHTERREGEREIGCSTTPQVDIPPSVFDTHTFPHYTPAHTPTLAARYHLDRIG